MSSDSEESRATIKWLNSLTSESAFKLLKLMEAVEGPVRVVCNWDDSINLGDFVSISPDTIPDGEYWAAWATCRTVKGGKHVRHAFNLKNTNGKATTPHNPRMKSCQGADLKRILNPQEWEDLKDIPKPAATTQKTNVKIWAHHAACVANPLLSHLDEKVPLNAGAGGSVDHVCGLNGCITPEHCLRCDVHQTNIDRIGCLGIMLHHAGPVITAVTPCKHCIDGDVYSSCRKIQIVPMPETYQIAESMVPAYETALDRCADQIQGSVQPKPAKRSRINDKFEVVPYVAETP